MKQRFYLLVCILFFTSFQCYAQNKLVDKANEKYASYSFSPAIDIYKKVLDRGYVSADLLKKLGNSYYFNANYKEAAQTYKKLVANYPDDLAPEYYFRYAQTLKTLKDYKAASAIMTKFFEATNGEKMTSTLDEKRDYIKEIKQNSGRYNVAPFPYNSPYSEFAPTFYKQGLLFSSDRDTGNFARYRHTWTSEDFLDLYSIGVDSISSRLVTKLDDHVNTRLHESTSAVTKDGKTLYFTRNSYKDKKFIKGKDGVIRLKIFRATLVEGVWSNIEELPFNNDAFSVANPALSSDEKTLYFASDMPGTIGESDIFKVDINQDGSFGQVENLGNTINTTARETFPFVSSAETLYFSSDGHPGLGGLDVFATQLSNPKNNIEVVNVGEPINSSYDDFTFIIDAGSGHGYFASNRAEGLGSDDIYEFDEIKPLISKCTRKVSGTVFDDFSKMPLAGAKVKVIDENNDEIAMLVTDENGKYEGLMNCNEGSFVRATYEGYIPSEEYLTKSDDTPKTVDFYLEKNTVSAGFGDDLSKLLQLSTIYFNYNKYNLRKDSEVEVEKVIAAMDKYPSLKIKVNAHTDSRGKDAYNLWLSQKRAEATIAYMAKKGISKDRLSSEGFGETKLINECENGVECAAAQHEQNRRSEFIIIE